MQLFSGLVGAWSQMIHYTKYKLHQCMGSRMFFLETKPSCFLWRIYSHLSNQESIQKQSFIEQLGGGMAHWRKLAI